MAQNLDVVPLLFIGKSLASKRFLKLRLLVLQELNLRPQFDVLKALVHIVGG